MEKKLSKKIFSALFAPKSKSGCCNIKFEEITLKNKPDSEKLGTPVTKEKDVKEPNENLKQNL